MVILLSLAIGVGLLILTILFVMIYRINSQLSLILVEKERQIDLVQRMMKDLVTHDQMEKYLQALELEVSELSRYKEKYSKERWANYHKAFGGKKEESEEEA